jgi:hypothetical protein
MLESADVLEGEERGTNALLRSVQSCCTIIISLADCLYHSATAAAC